MCEYKSCTLKGLEKHKQEAHKDLVNKPANSLETLKNQVLQNQEKGRWVVKLQKLDDQASEDSRENKVAFNSESREVSSAGDFDQAISNKNESEAPKKIDTTHLIGTRIGKGPFNIYVNKQGGVGGQSNAYYHKVKNFFLFTVFVY